MKNKVIKAIIWILLIFGIIGAAAALSKGFTEIPEFLITETETIEHHEGTSEQHHEEQIHFTKDDVLEISGEILLQNVSKGMDVQRREFIIDDSNVDDTVLKFEIETYYNNGIEDSYSITDFKWGAKISYVLSNGSISNDYYGCNNKHEPKTVFPESCLNGCKTYIYFSLNSINPNNELYLCDELNAKEVGKLFVMSSGSQENPDFFDAFGRIYLNNGVYDYIPMECSINDDNKPYYYSFLNDPTEDEYELSIHIEEVYCNEQSKEYNFSKSTDNKKLTIDNTQGIYSKFFILLTSDNQSREFLDEKVIEYNISDNNYSASLIIYGELNSDNPEFNMPSHPGEYLININNSDLASYFDAFGSADIFVTNYNPSQKIYFKINYIKTFVNGDLVDTIDNLEDSNMSSLEVMPSNNYIPSLNYSILYIGMNTSDDEISYCIDVVIIYFESLENFGDLFLRNYSEIGNGDNAYKSLYNKYDYLTIEPLINNIHNIHSDGYIEIKLPICKLIQVDTDEFDDEEFDPLSISDEWQLYSYKVRVDDLKIKLRFKNISYLSQEREVFIGKGKFSIYLNSEPDFIDYFKYYSEVSEMYSILVERRNDLKLKGTDLLTIEFGHMESIDDSICLYTDGNAVGSIPLEGFDIIWELESWENFFNEDFSFTKIEISNYNNSHTYSLKFIVDYYDGSEVYYPLELDLIGEYGRLNFQPYSGTRNQETGIFMPFNLQAVNNLGISLYTISNGQEPSIIYENVNATNFENEKEYVIDPHLDVSNIGRLTKTGTLTWRKRNRTSLDLIDEKIELDSFEIVGNDSPKHIQCKKGGSSVVTGTLVNFDDYRNSKYYITIEFNDSFTQAGYNQDIVYQSIIGYIS